MHSKAADSKAVEAVEVLFILNATTNDWPKVANKWPMSGQRQPMSDQRQPEVADKCPTSDRALAMSVS